MTASRVRRDFSCALIRSRMRFPAGTQFPRSRVLELPVGPGPRTSGDGVNCAYRIGCVRFELCDCYSNTFQFFEITAELPESVSGRRGTWVFS